MYIYIYISYNDIIRILKETVSSDLQNLVYDKKIAYF